MKDEFLDFIEGVIVFSKNEIHKNSCDELQLKSLKQVREKYIELKIKNLENDIQAYRTRSTILP